ncbi:MAG: peptidoglycan bridge formation glycyltransferase FemA/FemB family protein [Oscillospiraceae bacterium]|nr:peptidoglycan bridge formation glycyltransferase FemA/FemB family protein [Oscillospiraceae bacterium]
MDIEALHYEVLEEKDYDSYEAFVLNHEHGCFMQSKNWAKVKSNWKHEVVVAKNGQGVICAGMSILIMPMGPGALMYAPRGPVCDYSDKAAITCILEGAAEVAKKYHAHILKMDPYILEDEQAVIDVWVGAGCSFTPHAAFKDTIQPRYNYMLPYIGGLSEDDLMAKFVRDTRYYIRYPQKKGVICKHGNELMDDFYKIYSETGERQGFSIRPRSYLEGFLNAFPEHARLYMCYFEDKPLCGGIAVNYAGKTAHVYGCSTDEMRNVRPTYLLQWELMKWALSTGCTIYDMQGVAIKKEDSEALYGVLGFKQNFTGEIVTTAGEFEVIYRPTVNAALNAALNAAMTARKKMHSH